MKKLFAGALIFFLFFSHLNAQETKDEKHIRQIEIELNNLQKLIDSKLYFSAYEKAEKLFETVDTKKQTKRLLSQMRELKDLSPKKPVSECENLRQRIKNGETVPQETLFFYDCQELLKEK